MSHEMFLVVLVIISALFFDFVVGWNDSANAIATVISTRVLTPLQALLLAAALNFAGAYISTKVAKMIGGGLVDPAHISQTAVLAAMFAAAVWIAWCTTVGLPISGTHSLVGGIVGAVIVHVGMHALKAKGIIKVLIALFVSPILGFVLSFIIMVVIYWLCRKAAPGWINKTFGKLQILSVSFMALNHGMNDAQKAMGVITMALVSGGFLQTVHVPIWVITICAAMMALGTYVGGWNVIKTVGVGITHLKPVHGFAAETGASIVLSIAAAFGIPVSTTHVISSAIMGVGATRRLSAVRWGLGLKIVYAWLFTLPACGFLAALIYKVFSVLGWH
ncbi:MAG: anion permease [Candidatus Omnitrophica bacterium CG11_big_fil_rev_8_21_14_0_20_45_26]|uniref:Anion permease n=1 Tax=Candidatus Abzuiibacterium crystallinum TaxID=1974748 RepID=A0A2H0LMU7_9BACT|nr:MAG: anion permease [Candidatus Omnitrophica bacterium CG11_big_fil_rev_8_21_14_0_20_45_26]PIW64134.1 MAG: anion permease [Candidatus Omnitrophica bacterium CG12_big_fil_rev_8_21_14_0_65_45_16]